MSESVIEISEVRKRYSGGVEALRGVSLKVPRGGIFGLLGPNGAGKSTLVKILMTIVRPTRCQGTMLGEAIGHKPTLAKVGYLPEHAKFPEYLKGKEVIRYVAGLAGISGKEAQLKSEKLLELVGMQEWGNHKMGTYSKGMKQRIGLAQALVNDPAIVFLDEPTDGVDPKGRLEMRNILLRMRDEGRTVFINSHLLGELEMICDSVAILDQGKLIRQGTIDELTSKSQRYEIITQGNFSDELKNKLLAQGAEIDGGILTLFQTDPEPIQKIIDSLRADNITISEIKMVRQSLESLFMEAVGDTVGGISSSRKSSPPPLSTPPPQPSQISQP